MTDQVPTEEQLDTLLALHTATSPGEWTTVTLPPSPSRHFTPAYWVETVHSDGTAQETRTVADCPWRAADADLIAATHTALPTLVAEIRRLRVQLAAVDEEIDDFEEAATADPDTPSAALNMIRLLRAARTQAVV